MYQTALLPEQCFKPIQEHEHRFIPMKAGETADLIYTVQKVFPDDLGPETNF